MNDTSPRGIAVTALKHAIPYLRIYKGKTFVIKTGGAVFADRARVKVLLEQVGILHQVGIRTVLVHGGGPQASELLRSFGAEPRFVEGRRVTDEKTLDVTTMVLNGSINTQILAHFRDLDVPAVGLSGVDAGLIRARRRPPVPMGGGESPDATIDYGFVGDVESVDVDVLFRLIEAGLLPVVSPISADEKGTLLNINADTIAAAIAVAMRAQKLVVLTGAPGILDNPDDPTSVVSMVDLERLATMRDGGKLSEGMLPKAKAIEDAVRGGVERVHVISHDVPDSLLLEIFTNEGAGTLVVASTKVLTQAEQAASGGASAPAGARGA